jgi:acyl carrier protein
MSELTRAEVVEILIEELRAMEVALPAAAGESLSFRDDLQMDSLDVAEYVARLEQRFRVAIPDEVYLELHSVRLAADHVMERLGP